MGVTSRGDLTTAQTPHAANAPRQLNRVDASPVRLGGRVCRRRNDAQHDHAVSGR